MKLKRKTVVQAISIALCSTLFFVPGAAQAVSLKADYYSNGHAIVHSQAIPVVTVKSGDTLSALAQKFNLTWQGIYCTNRKVIGPNPNILNVGTRLLMKSTNCYQDQVTLATSVADYKPTGSPQQIAWALLAYFGGSRPSQYSCLNSVIMRESSWNVFARNPYSGAYGIPQALPGWKMGPGWQYSAYVQLHWMIDTYIPSSYRTPCGAWSHELSFGWY